MRPYNPTEEQKAATAARKTRFREYVKQIAAMSDEQRNALVHRIAPTTCEGHALSVANMMLIALQLPSATLVGGFRQWRKQGRCVKKGEHGAMIWCPGKAKEEETPENGDDAPEGKQFFIIGTVFDLLQTEEVGKKKTDDERFEPKETEAPVIDGWIKTPAVNLEDLGL